MVLDDIRARLKRLHFVVLSIVMALLISANTAFTCSPLIGTIASVVYVILVGLSVGDKLIGDEEERPIRFMFGILLLIASFILIGTPIVLFYELNSLSLAVILCAPIALMTVYMQLKRHILGIKGRKTKSTIQAGMHKVSYLSPVYIVYIGLVAYCIFLLVSARSGWVEGTVWSVVSPSFFSAYLLAAFVLVGVILYSHTRTISKLVLTIIFSLLSTMIFAIVLFPGNFGDPFDHMSRAVAILNDGNLRGERPVTMFHYYWMLKEKGLALLTAIVAKMFVADVYWVHAFITPVLWGIFMPLITYKITEIIGGGERVSVLAAFLTTFYSGFIVWASRSTANSLAHIPFFMSLYFTLWYLKSSEKTMALPLAIVSAIVTALVHRLPGMLALLFILLARALKTYEIMKPKSPLKARFLIVIALTSCAFAIPAAFGLNNLIYAYFAPALSSEASTAFSFGKLVATDVWELIFGEYVTYTFKDAILSGLIPLLGIAGLVYALTNKDKYERVLTSFMFLALAICLIDYRVMKYCMVNVLFGPGRIWSIRDLIAVPFAGLTIGSLARFFGQGSTNPGNFVFSLKEKAVKLRARHILAVLLIGLSLSAFAQSSIYKGYAWLGGLQPTQLEVDAVKYIDEHTNEGYIVLTMPRTTQVGYAFMGYNNFEKYYVYSKDLGMYPSVYDMFSNMRKYEATVGYFVACSFRTPDFSETIAEASRIFGLFKILRNENGEIYIFNYKIPPLPSGVDVEAFYWDTPPSYIVQNNLMRVIFNPVGETLNVEDYFGYVYESMDLNSTLIEGKPLGSLKSINYYVPSNDVWVDWNPGEEIPSTSALAEQFNLRLQFENRTLIAVVERGEPNVQLSWEGAGTSTLTIAIGDFTRLYVPGLVGGENSYNVSSREYGLLYTLSRTENVVLRPAYKPDVISDALIYSEIVKYCDLSLTTGYMTYDLYVDNNDAVGQWAYVEVWLPDIIYQGIIAPISYSPDDGETWIGVSSSREPITTLAENRVNWLVTRPGKATEQPFIWSQCRGGDGGLPNTLPGNFTDSGGGQNRLLFGLYLPAGDKALVRLGTSIYYCRPLKITYVFEDSDNISYGLRNMEKGLIKFYNYGSSVYVGGLNSTIVPTMLTITETEEGRIEEILATIPKNSIFNFIAMRQIDTTLDGDGNGIPDNVEE